MRPWLAVAAVSFFALGCGPNERGNGSDAQTVGTQGGYPQDEAAERSSAVTPGSVPAAPPSPAAAKRGAAGQVAGDAAGAADRLPSTDAATEAAAPMIIRTGNASIEVDTLEPAVALLQQLITRLGGYVANTSMQGGREQLRQAMLELKVPAARFDDLTSGLGGLGKLEYVNIHAEDVGEEYTDVTARVANARRLEGRLIDLLASRTGKLQDVLAVERELARVRETIERYEGRLRYLKTRTAVSTLAVTLHEPPPLLADNPGRNDIGDALVRAWRNFVAVVAALIASTGFLVPLAAVVALAVFLWRRYRKP
jgi:hypothetical protein